MQRCSRVQVMWVPLAQMGLNFHVTKERPLKPNLDVSSSNLSFKMSYIRFCVFRRQRSINGRLRSLYFSFFAILKPKWAQNSYLRQYMQCTSVGKISAHGVESRLGIEDFIECTLRTLVSKLRSISRCGYQKLKYILLFYSV